MFVRPKPNVTTIFAIVAQSEEIKGWLSFEKVTAVGLLLFALGVVVYGLIKEWWVPGWLYERECKNSAKWETLAMAAQKELAETAEAMRDLTETIKKLTDRPG